MLDLPLEEIRHRLETAVRVLGKAGSGGKLEVVEHDERVEVHELGQWHEPLDPGTRPFLHDGRGSDDDAHRLTSRPCGAWKSISGPLGTMPVGLIQSWLT